MPSRVLVVDDNPAMCELIQEVLIYAEMECVTFTDSNQAAKRLTKEKFNAIFLDVRMPPQDGIELTRTIRAEGLNRTTPVVIITCEEDRGTLARAFEAGASFFLFKPIDRQRILRLIRVTESSIMREARRYHRVKTSCKVSLQYGEERLGGVTLDLSLGEMFVQASDAIPVGTRVRVILETKPGTPGLELAGRVARLSGNDCMGIQFESLAFEQSQRLQEFLLPLILAKID